MLRFLASLLRGKARIATKPKSPRLRSQTRLSVEELSSRVLPSASSFGAHLFSHENHAFFSDSSNTSTSTATNSLTGDSRSSDGCHGAEATFAATLSNASGATGKASYNATTQTLNVRVTGAAASSTLDVAVDGTT